MGKEITKLKKLFYVSLANIGVTYRYIQLNQLMDVYLIFIQKQHAGIIFL
ncbi:hypothetical protein [Peribacillus sp. R9-11]|nr:hypothetical protein [Peribacillus sp. R9-11]WMX56022.1 hypothetical protein RE409_01810 [Peribacillus sp. R9-11]